MLQARFTGVHCACLVVAVPNTSPALLHSLQHTPCFMASSPIPLCTLLHLPPLAIMTRAAPQSGHSPQSSLSACCMQVYYPATMTPIAAITSLLSRALMIALPASQLWVTGQDRGRVWRDFRVSGWLGGWMARCLGGGDRRFGRWTGGRAGGCVHGYRALLQLDLRRDTAVRQGTPLGASPQRRRGWQGYLPTPSLAPCSACPMPCATTCGCAR